jgi:hypothetical protein
LLSAAIVADVIHPDELALAALSEEFGVYKFVDFATGKEGENLAQVSFCDIIQCASSIWTS